MTSLSIIIPTKNRAEVLKGTLESLKQCWRIKECEIIIVNDGSTDNTNLITLTFKEANPDLDISFIDEGSRGVAKQRNLAATIAKSPILLFSADDIRPRNLSWLHNHIELHAHQKESNFAALGRITWPSRKHLEITATMMAVQGQNGEQFGFADLNSNSYLDWRFFYTSNLSVKKSLVADWNENGFSAEFNGYGYEDIELAYRLSKAKGLKLFYSSDISAEHFQRISVSEFCSRQISAGRMAATFTRIHPELKGFLIPETKYSSSSPLVISHVLNLVQGLRSYAELLEVYEELGTEKWHTDLLHLLFRCEYKLGIASNSQLENQGHLVDFFENFLDQELQTFSREVSLRILGINVAHNAKSQRNGYNLHLFGRKILIPLKLYEQVMKNKLTRKLALVIKNTLGGRLS